MNIEITNGLIMFFAGITGAVVTLIAAFIFSVTKRKSNLKLKKQLDDTYSFKS